MMALTQQDLLSHAEYEKARASYRQRIIALKKRRRIALGDLITLIFENRETVLFQIQEMIRTERISDSDKIQEEIDVYNSLLPNTNELSATLFIEITDSERIQELLDSFQELDRPGTVAIQMGDETIKAEFEAGHSKEDKISAVHFIRFKTTKVFRQQLENSGIPCHFVVSHPHYQARVDVPGTLREEWLQDLKG
ncbi:MAG: DUF3501 family protein [Nitrospirales bacterium]|nr:DUF3501 family protein [Nitrospirales bacterium]